MITIPLPNPLEGVEGFSALSESTEEFCETAIPERVYAFPVLLREVEMFCMSEEELLVNVEVIKNGIFPGWKLFTMVACPSLEIVTDMFPVFSMA